ncbi:hypothetical protein MZA93_08495 [Haemophilus influenzae]
MPVHAVVKHPENLTMEQAAASWMMFVTAYGGLIEFGKVQKAILLYWAERPAR